MTNQVRIVPGRMPEIAGAGRAASGGWQRLRLCADAALRLGPRPVALWAAYRAALALGFPGRRLADRALPQGRVLPSLAGPPPALPSRAVASVLRAAAALPDRPDWHRGFDAAARALAIPLHRGPGARMAWEASRLAALPLLAQAARLDPGGGHLARAEALLADWCAANPPFRGVNWACGQEAALRALHLALALALLDADGDPPPGARALLGLCAARIAATPLYAAAQDNNHPVSEAAGAFACALLLGRPAARHAAVLAGRVGRLVAADGGFAQLSPGYARLLLDVLSIAEWLRRRHGAAPFPEPLSARAAACAAWLRAITEPSAGGTPPLGLEDGSAFADLSLAGPGDARGSVERALRLFAGTGGDAPGDPGCAWLGLEPLPAAPVPPRWRVAGLAGRAEAGALALLRTGPLRFRPGQCDLLHLSLRDGAEWVIRDGGTGSYDPPEGWWGAELGGAAAHNGAVFDGEDPMPRAGRFLLARWQRLRDLPGGAEARDSRGNRQARRLRAEGRAWTVEDELSGPFHRVALHWRLRPGPWRLSRDGVEGPTASIAVDADAPLRVTLRQGWESQAYGHIAATPVLVVEADAPVRRITTRITLPQGGEGGRPCLPRS
jgi:hypothetical protein